MLAKKIAIVHKAQSLTDLLYYEKNKIADNNIEDVY